MGQEDGKLLLLLAMTAPNDRAQGLDRVSLVDAIASRVQFLKTKDICVHIRAPLRAFP